MQNTLLKEMQKKRQSKNVSNIINFSKRYKNSNLDCVELKKQLTPKVSDEVNAKQE